MCPVAPRRLATPGPTRHTFVVPRTGDTVASTLSETLPGWNASLERTSIPEILRTNRSLMPGLPMPGFPIYAGSSSGAWLEPRPVRDFAEHVHRELILGMSEADLISFAANLGSGAVDGATESLARVRPLLDDIVRSYKDMRAGKITKSAHYAYRTRQLKRIADYLTPMLEKSIFANPAGLRVSVRSGRLVTKAITTGGYEALKNLPVMLPAMADVSRFAKVAKTVSRTGLLGGIPVDGALGCLEVYSTDDPVAQSAAAAGTMGSIGGGVAGTGLVLFLMASATGGLALVVAAALAGGFGGVGGGWLGRKAYEVAGQNFHLVDYTPLALCKREN